MPEIPHKSLPQYLQSNTDRPQIILVGGEEYLGRKALEQLLDALLPIAERAFNCETFDGRFDEQVTTALEQVNTYAMLSPVRVIVITDAPLMDTRANTPTLLETVTKARQDDDQKAAAAAFLKLLSRLNLTYEDCLDAAAVPEELFQAPWFKDMTAHCRDAGMTIPESQDISALLLQALEKGFPSGNHLILLAASLDKRAKLCKTIATQGLLINCEVPRGERKVDREAQAAVIQDCINGVLKTCDKKMDGAARKALQQLTGFDPRLVVNNLEKLIDYVGARPLITADDVTGLLQRTRKDPIFELTGAVGRRSLDQALFYTRSLLADNLQPLQILAAITNQTRRLLLAHEFLASSHAQGWRSNCAYSQFQVSVFPQVENFDAEVTAWVDAPSVAPEQAMPTPKGKRGRAGTPARAKAEGPKTDLIMGKNPYPLYLLLQNAARYTPAHLLQTMARLQQADLDLKTSSREPEMVLEEVLLFMLSVNQST